MTDTRATRRTWLAAATATGLVLAFSPIGRGASGAIPSQVASIPCASQSSATADFDRDGTADLAVGSPGDGLEKAEVDGSRSISKPGAGSVNIVYGARPTSASAPRGLQPGNGPPGAPRFLSEDSPGVVDDATAGDRFGSSLATGDFNGDGRADLAVGAPGEDAQTGAVHVFYAGGPGAPGIRLGTPGSATHNQVIRAGSRLSGSPLTGVRNPGDLFGWALAGGDFNNDGYADLAIGAPGWRVAGRIPDGGAVLVVAGSARGLTGSGHNWLAGSGVGDITSERGDYFGAALAAGDFNGSTSASSPRADDLAVGAPGEDIGRSADAGAISVYYGAKGGGVFFNANTRDVPAAPATTSDRFGCSLAAGNFDNDAANDTDLAIGVPGKDSGAETDAGAVITIYNSRGLTTGAAPEDCSTPVPPPPGSTGVVVNNTIGSSTTPRITANDCWIDSQRWTENAGGIPGVSKRGDQFGGSLFSEDLNEDGPDDLIAGEPNENLYGRNAAGSIRVLFGFNKFGLTDSRAMAFAQRPPDPCTADEAENIGRCAGSPEYSKVGMVVELNDRFGQAVAVGDFDGNGIADIAVGVPGESISPALNYLFEEVVGHPGTDVDDVPGAGAVQVIYGSRSGSTVTVGGGEPDVLYRQQGRPRTVIDALSGVAGESNGAGWTSGDGLVGNPGLQAADGGPTTSGTVEGDRLGAAVG